MAAKSLKPADLGAGGLPSVLDDALGSTGEKHRPDRRRDRDLRLLPGHPGGRGADRRSRWRATTRCRSASSWRTSPSSGTPPRRPPSSSGVIAILILLVNIGNASIFLVVTSVSIILVYIAYLLVTVPTLPEAPRRLAGGPGRHRPVHAAAGRGASSSTSSRSRYGALMALNLIWPRHEIYGAGNYQWGGVHLRRRRAARRPGATTTACSAARPTRSPRSTASRCRPRGR